MSDHISQMGKKVASPPLPGPTGSAIRDAKEFIASIVEMTDGAADINKRSLIKPGITIRREAGRILALLEKQLPNH